MSPRMGGYVPADHKTRHQDGGRDEISIASLAGNPANRGAASGLASLNASSKVVEQPASISDFLEASPTDGEATKAPDSNWAFDHAADLDAHTKSLIEVLRTGVYYHNAWGASDNVAIAANTLYGVLLVVARDITADRIAIHVTTGAAGAARLGIYNVGTNLYPGTLLLDAGMVDVSGTGVKAITISQALTKGIYFLAFVSNATPTIKAAALYAMGLPWLGCETDDFGLNRMGWSGAFTYAALPDPFTAAGTTHDRNWRIAVRVLSLD